MVRLIILRLTESFFRNRGLYQLPVVLMILLAGLYVLRAPRVYVSSGTLYVQQDSLLSSLTNSGSGGAWWITPAQATVSEVYELLSTDAFVRTVIAKTALEEQITANPASTNDAIQAVRQAIGMQPVGDNLIRFGGTFEDPLIAQQVAQATVDTYLQWKLNADQRESVVAQEFFARQLEPFQQELIEAQNDLQAYLSAHPEPVRGDRPVNEQLEVDQLRGRVAQAIDRIEKARTRSDDARLSQSISENEVYQNYRVVDAPTLPVKPTLGLRGALTNVIIFIVVGLALSIGGIAGGAVLDRSMRFPLDISQRLSLPVIAVIPAVSGADQRRKAAWFGRKRANAQMPHSELALPLPIPRLPVTDPQPLPTLTLEELIERKPDPEYQAMAVAHANSRPSIESL